MSRSMSRPVGLMALVALALMLIAVFAAGPALAVTQSPQWTVTAFPEPTNLPPGGMGTYSVEVKNTGGAASDGSEITVADVLPSALKLQAGENASGRDLLSEAELSCTGLTCKYSGVMSPDDVVFISIPVEVAATQETTETNVVTVSGGGAPEAIRETPTTISSTSAPFGIALGSTATALSTTQAGAHSDFTTNLSLNTGGGDALLSGDARETGLDLPPGFVIDVADTPSCSTAQFSEEGDREEPTCSLSTQVGTVTLRANLTGLVGFHFMSYVVSPVYNLTTNPGEIAKLGFYATTFGVQGTITVRPGDYGGRTTFQGIRYNILAGVSLTVWGVPSESIHDAMRGLDCFSFGSINVECHHATGPRPNEVDLPVKSLASTSPATPFFTNMTQCTGEPSQGTLFASSWQEPESSGNQLRVPTSFGTTTGCNLLEFGPSITAAPDTNRADTPAGLTFDVKVPQEGLTSPGGLSSADIENTTATLPAGVVINPGQAAGLGACQISQEELTTEAEEKEGKENSGPPKCPSDSTVGEVEVETPLLKNKLKGKVYLLQSNPPNIKLLVAPEDPADGLYVKFIGTVHLNETTGQLVTTFEKTPELPFSNLRLSFSGGAQAALATPTGCGTYTTNAAFAPWSGESEALTSSGFAIESGPGGSACASPLPFSPSMIAGATTDQAGGYTDFSLLLQRGDGQQRIEKLQFKIPEGLSGAISRVPLCGAPQAAEGTCPAASQIGHTDVESGPGPYPLVIPEPGQPPAPIYLTGPYEGAPFGLSIVVPLHVGPFTLKTQIVRAKLEVDPHTAQITVTTDPLPQIVAGVPTDLRTIDAVIDRPGFMFNPTNCNRQSFSGTATSNERTTAAISSPFQVGSCQSLAFKPQLAASTLAKSSKADGAGLTVKLTYPNTPQGTEANVAKVKVDLPKQLPSRLTTLQKACVAKVFEANPAGCPAASIVGHAKAITPILPVPLEGPAYFVSHGGEAFPSLIFVLQGYGVTEDLVGTTFISKAGITSSTFEAVPDVPVGSFELTLPQERYSALAANLPAADRGSFCGQKLTLPTAFVGQNGAEIHTSTPLSVSGCKPAITVIRHSVKGKTATIVVSVPAAGRLLATGKGVSTGRGKAGKAGNVRVKVTLTKAEQAFLRKHHGRKLRAKINLRFIPRKGAKLTTSVTVLIA